MICINGVFLSSPTYLFYFLIVCACMHVYACVVCKRTEGGRSVEEGGEYTHECNRQELALRELVLQVVVSHPKWMLGTKHMSSSRAVSALNC